MICYNTSGMKTFASVFKRYRLRAEFETFTAFGDALAEKGYHYDDSIFSHWQKGTRVPSNRQLLLTIITIFTERGAIKTENEANELLAAAGFGYLTEDERKFFFIKNTSELQSKNFNLFEQLNRLMFGALAIVAIIFFSIYAFIDIPNALIAIIFSINFIVSLLLYLYATKRTATLTFFNIFAFGSSAWCLAMIFYRAASAENAILAAKFLYLFPLATPTAFLLFGLFFPHEKVNKFISTVLIVCTMILAFLTLGKDSVIVNVIIPAAGEKIITFGWGYYASYIFYYPIFFTLGYYIFFKKWLHAKGETKKQLFSILIGMLASSIPAMITNLFLPTLGDYRFNWVGQLFTIFWIIGVYIAIVKYKLLNLHQPLKKFSEIFNKNI